MATDVRFVAELSGVTEVSLLGTADLHYWQDRLRPHGLVPAPRDGAAQILIVGAKARFLGVPFREVSFSVLVSPNQERHGLQDAACLLRAFHSNRFFAFCERTFFTTPYYPASCEVSLDPIRVNVSNQKECLFSAEMGGDRDRETFQHDDNGWYGTVAIIPPKKLANAPHKYFVAKISGQTMIYPFESSIDRVELATDNGIADLSQLVESGFHGKEWIIRASANHAKSKTYTSGCIV